jgi:hypothetical protein
MPKKEFDIVRFSELLEMSDIEYLPNFTPETILEKIMSSDINLYEEV